MPQRTRPSLRGHCRLPPRHLSLGPAPRPGTLHPPSHLPRPMGRRGGCHRGSTAVRHFAVDGKGKSWSSRATTLDVLPLGHRSVAGKGKARPPPTTANVGGRVRGLAPIPPSLLAHFLCPLTLGPYPPRLGPQHQLPRSRPTTKQLPVAPCSAPQHGRQITASPVRPFPGGGGGGCYPRPKTAKNQQCAAPAMQGGAAQ